MSRGVPWLIVSGSFVKTGGQDRANLALASYLADQGGPVHLVAHSVEPELGRRPTVINHVVRQPFGSNLFGGPLIRRAAIHHATALRAHTPRVVVNGGNCDWPDVNWVHYVHAAYDDAGGQGALTRARLAMTRWMWLAEERQALGRARVVIANSHRTRMDLIERVGVPSDRIHVVYYGIDAEQFHSPAPGERERTRAAMAWALDRPIVVFVGALGDRRKGFDTLFQAWITLARRQSNRALLVVIGQGAMLPEWKTRAADVGLESSIQFLGFRNDVPALMRAADALVSPTRYEAYGLGVHEALCCGLPAVVSSDAGVAERYPAELRDLLLPDVDDAERLADRIERSLSMPTDMKAHLARLARDLRARSWNDMAAEIVAVAGGSHVSRRAP